MENASKALIIAGAILLAIVIISLGLIVVNNTRDTVDSAKLSEQEIQTFNAKFIPYEGSNKTGTQVKTLLQAVIASNQANSGNTDKTIKTQSNGTDTDADKITITSGGSYTVEITYAKGLVHVINIK